jgi:hypothetical protein
MRSAISVVDVDRIDTWTRYKKDLCDSCQPNCRPYGAKRPVR